MSETFMPPFPPVLGADCAACRQGYHQPAYDHSGGITMSSSERAVPVEGAPSGECPRCGALWDAHNGWLINADVDPYNSDPLYKPRCPSFASYGDEWGTR